jgi:hypothetical protein
MGAPPFFHAPCYVSLDAPLVVLQTTPSSEARRVVNSLKQSDWWSPTGILPAFLRETWRFQRSHPLIQTSFNGHETLVQCSSER